MRSRAAPAAARSCGLSRLAVTAVFVTVDRAAVRAGPRTCGATVNDALLWAWARAFARADLARAGPGERVVVSVPATAPGSRFGNHLGALRIAVPGGDSNAAETLAVPAAWMRHAGSRIRPWTWPLAPFGACVAARLGLLPVVLRRQRLLSTVVTHAPGPPGACAGGRCTAPVDRPVGPARRQRHDLRRGGLARRSTRRRCRVLARVGRPRRRAGPGPARRALHTRSRGLGGRCALAAAGHRPRPCGRAHRRHRWVLATSGWRSRRRSRSGARRPVPPPLAPNSCEGIVHSPVDASPPRTSPVSAVTLHNASADRMLALTSR